MGLGGIWGYVDGGLGGHTWGWGGYWVMWGV